MLDIVQELTYENNELGKGIARHIENTYYKATLPF